MSPASRLITVLVSVILATAFFLWPRALNAPATQLARTSRPPLPSLSQVTTTPATVVEPAVPSAQPLQILFAGDIMLDRAVWAKIRAQGDDYPFQKIGDLFKSPDLAIANFENPMTNRGSHAQANGPLLFKSDPRLAPALAATGLDAVSLANNHTYNQGSAGLADTVTFLSQAGIHTFGSPRAVQGQDVYTTDVKGWPLAFVGWNTIETPDSQPAALLRLVAQLHGEGRIVIVMAHWGVEYHPKTPQEVLWAHQIIDAGADIVVGAHPHVVQGIELYKNHPIIYSLGNFVFDQYFSAPTQEGLAVRFTLSDPVSGSFQLVPIDLRNSQPRLASDPIVTNAVRDAVAADSATDLRGTIVSGKTIQFSLAH